MSEQQEHIPRQSYAWLGIDTPDDYANLGELLGFEYGPAAIASSLRSDVTREVKGLLLEYQYTDKDYRSTFYNFYAKMGRLYRQHCVRLHFFDGEVRLQDNPLDLLGPDDRLDNHYFGYIVLRPTITATLGRSLLSPRIRVEPSGNHIRSRHRVHLLGNTLSVWGFPSMAQHADISVCAHVACWAILRHYSEHHSQFREFLMHEITMLARPPDPGGLTPSLGLNVFEAERIFQAAGCYPLLITREWDRDNDAWATDDSFFEQMFAYLDSGFPLFVAVGSGATDNQGHAVVLVGYEWHDASLTSGSGSVHVRSLVSNLISIDDNELPYSSVPVGKDAQTYPEGQSFSVEDFNAFVVPLTDKIYYSAQAVDRFALETLDPTCRNVLGLPADIALLRRSFIATVSEIRRFARENASNFGTELVNLYMRLNTTRFVWVVELATERQWSLRQVSARAILDASASIRDKQPMWLYHDHELATVFDRSSPVLKGQSVALRRPTGSPLGRMEINLQTVRASPENMH